MPRKTFHNVLKSCDRISSAGQSWLLSEAPDGNHKNMRNLRHQYILMGTNIVISITELIMHAG